VNPFIIMAIFTTASALSVATVMSIQERAVPLIKAKEAEAQSKIIEIRRKKQQELFGDNSGTQTQA